MSGPITRQYGVPNWDEIFGKKDEQPADAQPQPSSEADSRKEQQPERNKSSSETDAKQ